MQWVSSRCYTAGTLIKFGGGLYQPPSTDRGQIWYTILLNCPILPSSVDSVAAYSEKKGLRNFRILSSLVALPNLLHKNSNVGAHLPLSNGTKFVSKLQLVHGDMAFTNSAFPKAWWTKKQTYKKTIELFAPLAAWKVQAPPNLAWW